jgi:hypothetical protein
LRIRAGEGRWLEQGAGERARVRVNVSVVLRQIPVILKMVWDAQAMKATLTHPIVWIFAGFLCLYNGVRPLVPEASTILTPAYLSERDNEWRLEYVLGSSRPSPIKVLTQRSIRSYPTVTTFLLKERNANPKTVGYVSSGRYRSTCIQP